MSTEPLPDVPTGLARFVQTATASQRALIVWRAYQAVAAVRLVLDDPTVRVRGLTQSQYADLERVAANLDSVLP